MVKEINNPVFICEWPGCGREYKSKEEAIDCEEQGFIGPNLKSGLISKISNYYNLLIGECDPIGHQRQYSFISFRKINSKVPKWDKWKINKEIFKTKELKDRIKYNQFKTLDKKEFEDIKAKIEKGNELEQIKEILIKHHVKNLYRSSSYFRCELF